MAFVDGYSTSKLSFRVRCAPLLRRGRIVAAVWVMIVTLGSSAAGAETGSPEPSPQHMTEPAGTNPSSPIQQQRPGATQPIEKRVVGRVDRSDTQFQQELSKARKLKETGLAVGAGSYLGLVTFLSVALLMPVVLGWEPSSENPKLSHLLPLYVPLVGPVWSLSYSDVNKDRGAWFWYGLLGAGQIAGTAIFVTGIAKTPSTCANSGAATSLTLAPLFDGRGQHGIAVMGRF